MDSIQNGRSSNITGKVEDDKVFQKLPETVSVFLWLLDEKGTIIAMNSEVTGQLGYTRSELIGKPLFSVDIFPDDFEKGLLRNTEISGSQYKTETSLKTNAGERFKVYLIAEKTTILENTSYLVTALNVAPEKTNPISGQDGNLSHPEHDPDKDNIYSVIAHDLRGPFNTILGYCELLSGSIKRNDPEKSLQYNSIIQSAAEKMLNFLIRLLEWGRIQQGQIAFNPVLFSIEDQVREILQLTKFQAETKKIRIRIRIEPGLRVFGDLNMIRTILINLISNGIKFSKVGGKIDISSRTIQDGIEFVVSDDGIGIMPEDKARLFIMDQHFTTKGTGKEQGTGLGLSLCKKFVDLHGGKIWAESEPGEGSRFIFTLPAVNIE